MKKTIEKAMAIMFCSIMMLGIAPLNGLAEVKLPSLSSVFLTKASATDSGTCGDNLTWNYDSSTNTLTISGTGDMYQYSLVNYSSTTAPWKSYYHSIKTVIIKNGVTSIGSSAFSGCTGFTSVTIPNSVTSIGSSAFSYCAGLKSVTIPNSVTSIGNLAFGACTGLTSVTIPNSVTSIGRSAFSDCTGLTSVTIPNSVTSIGSSAFSSCTGLTSVSIGNSVTSIGEDAFYRCTGLTSVSIPNSVTSIGDDAFYYCNSLASITIPDSVTSIGSSAFYNTAYYNNASNWSNGILYIGNHLIKGKTDLSGQVSIKPNTICIAGKAFYGCTGLTSVTIPDSVTSIGEDAFYRCTGLTSVSIPNSVTSIGDDAFYYCNSLASITIPDSVTIGRYAFDGCSGLKSLTIGNGVTGIENNAFSVCPLEYVKMGSGFKYIPSSLIKKDTLKTFIIGNNVASIDSSAFSGCTGLTSVTIPNSVTFIGSSAFSGCAGLKSVTIPNSVTSIGWYAFDGCSGLTSIHIPDSVTSIGSSAFYNTAYYNNQSNWTNGILYIGKHLIKGKTDLTGNITVKQNTICIADEAFYKCTGLTNITIPNSVTSIGYNAFSNVRNVNYTGKAWGSPWGANCVNGYADGLLVYRDSGKKKLVACSTLAKGSVVIPASTDTIEDSAFYSCSMIEAVYIPVNVTRIGKSAFQGTAITDIYYGGGATEKLVLSIADDNSKLNEATWHYNSKISDMPHTAVYTLTYNANGGSSAPASQTGSGYVTTSSSKPERKGYTFLGWATTAGATNAQYNSGSLINLDRDIILYAVWQNGSEPDIPSLADVPKANIIGGNNSDGQKTYNYKSTVTFTANVPEGGSVQWYVDGKESGNEQTLTVKESKKSYTVTVAITDRNGNRTKDTEKVTIKSGFFDKLIWFFVHLFNPGAYDIKQ